MTIETLLDGTFGKYHLWFLMALFMGGILFYVFLSWNLSPKELFFIGTLLYLISMLEAFPVNQLFSYGGFPKGLFYLTMGNYIGKLRVDFKPSLWYFFSFLTLYVLMSILISTSFINLLLAPATFFLMLFVKTNKGKKTAFSKLGTYSLEIYIVHVFIIESYELLISYFPTIDPDSDFLRIVLLTFASVLFSIALYKPVQKVFLNPINGVIDRIINVEKYSDEI